MKTRQLVRTDLPKRGRIKSLHILVLYNGKERFISDIHYVNPDLCYLEHNNGKPVKISELLLVTDKRTNEVIQKKIKTLQMKRKQINFKISELKSLLKQ